MYDFLLTEEFWMSTIITACASAGATIILTILTWNYYMKKMASDVTEIKGQADNRRAEHEKLSGEHKDLKEKLSVEHKGIEDRIIQIMLEQQKQQSAREDAARQLPQESALLKMVEGAYLHSSQLANENRQLKELVETQQKQIENQQKQINKLKQRSRTLNHNSDIEAER